MRSRRYAPVEPSQVYLLMRWVLSLFAGAAINVVILSSLVYLLTFPSPVHVYSLLFEVVAFILLPIVLASLLTEIEPRRIIVPPAYIQVLTAGWFFATMPIDGFNWFLPSPKIRETVFVLVLFAVLGAAIDDQVTPRVLGYATPSALQVHCLVAKATIVEVQTRIMTDTYRRVIGLQKAPVETEEAVFLRRHKSEQWQVLIMLRKGKVNHETELAITAFNKEQYEISVPETAKQLAREKSLYIKEILMRPGQGATSINVREQKNKTIMAKDHDVLSSFVGDIEATGIFERVSKVSANIWVRIGLFAISYAVPVWLYVNNHLNDALTTFATITVTLAILSGVQLYSKKTK